MLRAVLVLLTVLGLQGCNRFEDLPRYTDALSFTWFGFTVFNPAEAVSLKELHFDKGSLLGHDVIVEGKLVEIGKFATYVIISDATARMLVILSEIDRPLPFLTLGEEQSKPLSVRILGSVENGKKGLPFLQAKAIAVAAEKAAGA